MAKRRDWLLVQTSITFVLGAVFLFGIFGPAPLAGYAVLEGDGAAAASSNGFRLLGLVLALASVAELVLLGMVSSLRSQMLPEPVMPGEDPREHAAHKNELEQAARVISARPRA